MFEHDVNTKATNKDTDKDLKTDPPLNPPRGNRGVKKFDPLDITLPNWISVSLWREWVEFRQALRKPIRTEQGANGAIRELEKFRQQGFSPEQVIRHSIANEYQACSRRKVFDLRRYSDRLTPSRYRIVRSRQASGGN